MDRNEAIKVIKHNWPEDRHQLSDALKTLIPELNESEDERIRKNCIHFLELQKSHHAATFEIDECITWLEKQAEQNRAIEGTFVNVDEVRDGFMQEVYRVLDADSSNDRANQIIDYFDHLPTITIHKPTDKVKPKFKVGDWIVYRNEDVVMITDIVDNGYLIDKGGCILFTSQGDMRYWTIQDTKDCDVLAEDSCIFILKEMVNGFHAAITYCTLFNDGEFHDGETLHFDIGSTRPATEEQRNLLFLKMKEAGYNFDPEKKELRKIEQKNTEWSEEDEIICQCLIKDQEEALDKVSNSKYGHSEIISDLKETYNEHIDWLKSLKESYAWKPSDDQMEALKDAVRLYKSTRFDSHHYKIETLYEDLKRLK